MRRLGTLSREDLALLEIEETDGTLQSLGDVFEDRELEFRPSAWTLLSDVPAPTPLGEAVLDVLATRRPSLFIQPDPRGDFAAIVLPTQSSGTIHLVTSLPVSDYRWHRLEREVRRSRSGLTPFSLELNQLTQLVSALEQHGPVTVSRTTGRSVQDGSSITRGWSHDRPSFDDAFAELIHHPAAVRTVTLWIGASTHLQLRRDGGATLYRGDVGLFESLVLNQLASFALMRAELLKDRARTLDEPLEYALQIHFSSPPFDNPGAIEELMGVLYSDPELGVAVLHGNPYFHASITDFEVASSADVFVTSVGDLTIFPGYRASMSFLSRLADGIAERFPFSHITTVPAHPEASVTEFIGKD